MALEEDAWGALDEAMELLESGKVDEAEAMVRAFIKDHPEDVAGPAALDVVADVRAGRSMAAEVPLAEETVEVDPFALHCLTCGHRSHAVSRALLNTRWVTLFGYDELNREATCHSCRTCGHVHWFLPGMPGIFQRLQGGDGTNRHDAPPLPEGGGGCMFCGFDSGEEGSALLNTRWASFFGLEFLNRRLATWSCHRCGYVHWRLRVEDGDPPAVVHRPPDPPLQGDAIAEARACCLSCGSTNTHATQGLVNSRVTTHLDLDWMDPGAVVSICDDCHFGTWYLPTD